MLKQGLVLTGIGVTVGLIVASMVAQNAAGLLLGVDPSDWFTYFAVAALLVTISLLACYLPARRASRVDPTVALRQD